MYGILEKVRAPQFLGFYRQFVVFCFTFYDICHIMSRTTSNILVKFLKAGLSLLKKHTLTQINYNLCLLERLNSLTEKKDSVLSL
jgi:hypothetical protein